MWGKGGNYSVQIRLEAQVFLLAQVQITTYV